MKMTATKASPYGRISHVLETARSADPEVLAMSRRDCHCKGLDSIVIHKKRNGSLVRVFVAQPGSEIIAPKNEGLAVGIHNHRYPLRLIGLTGAAYNVEYSISPLHPTGGAPWDLILNAYRFGPMGSAVEFCGQRRMTQVSTSRIDDLILAPESLHTVVVSSSAGAAWVALEGQEVSGDPLCITDRDMTQWSPEGLYGRFEDPSEAVEVLARALEGGR